jgi:hypothetical protein
MGNILKPQEVIQILRVLGFEEIRQRGSHKLRALMDFDAVELGIIGGETNGTHKSDNSGNSLCQE